MDDQPADPEPIPNATQRQTRGSSGGAATIAAVSDAVQQAIRADQVKKRALDKDRKQDPQPQQPEATETRRCADEHGAKQETKRRRVITAADEGNFDYLQQVLAFRKMEAQQQKRLKSQAEDTRKKAAVAAASAAEEAHLATLSEAERTVYLEQKAEAARAEAAAKVLADEAETARREVAKAQRKRGKGPCAKGGRSALLDELAMLKAQLAALQQQNTGNAVQDSAGMGKAEQESGKEVAGGEGGKEEAGGEGGKEGENEQKDNGGGGERADGQ